VRAKKIAREVLQVLHEAGNKHAAGYTEVNPGGVLEDQGDLGWEMGIEPASKQQTKDLQRTGNALKHCKYMKDQSFRVTPKSRAM
jgi:hypothetical protein